MPTPVAVDSFLLPGIILILVLVILIIVVRRQFRLAAFRNIDTIIDQVINLVSHYDKALDFSSGYLMKKDWDALTKEAAPLAGMLLKVSQSARGVHKEAAAMRKLISYYQDNNLRTHRNAEYKEYELAHYGHLLNDISGKNLDAQQRDAVVTDEYSNLVIAGAGSGKTLTVVGKLKYLVERWQVNPEEILVTSFTRKSVDELAQRIKSAGIDGITTKTFHALGLSVLGRVGVANENSLQECIRQYLREHMLKDAHQIQAYLEFYGCFSAIPRDYNKFSSDGERFEDLKSLDLVTIKGRLENVAQERIIEHSTLQGERVNSLEELIIANFLFLNGVNYEYEKNYTGNYEKPGRAYQPDFFLADYEIWLEHFGINSDGRAPWIKNEFEEKKYVEGIQWKRQVHKANNTRLIESYSYWNQNHELVSKLKELLLSNGVKLDEDLDRLKNLYLKLKRDERFSRSIVELISTFISLYKANNSTAEAVDARAHTAYAGNNFMWHRYELFMVFVKPMIGFYKAALAEKKQIDFDDMINHATEAIRKNGISMHYKYIIVDEYQDISMSRFGLIKAIREKLDAKLICVGDDWQSIYRFAGSDVTLFTSFEKFSGYHEQLKIERTYRNSQDLVNIASKFIIKNSHQVSKKMVSDKRKIPPVTILSLQDQRKSLATALDRILASQPDYSGDILILGRHNFDLERMFSGSDDSQDEMDAAYGFSFKKYKDTGDVQLTYNNYSNIKFMSVHRAKGLEADDVIILNLINDLYGFPNKILDDPILNLLLADSDDYPYAEERRLFYVAITRTKNEVYIVTNPPFAHKGVSTFIDEIIHDNQGLFSMVTEEGEKTPVNCPRCGKGVLVIRKNSETGKEFLGCTNYPYCEKTYNSVEILNSQVKCPKCGGWMVKRSGQYGEFYGCSNYPSCTGTIDIQTGKARKYSLR